jgi:AraC-like DNA-binding protein
MDYKEHTPPPSLRDLVHRIWVLRGPADPAARFQRIMPDGRAELIFNLADAIESRERHGAERQPLSLLVGPNRTAVEIRPTGQLHLIGVRFRPEALSAWLRINASELVDRAYRVDDLPVPLERSLAEQLASVDDGAAVSMLCRHLAASAALVPADLRLRAAVELALGDHEARPAAIAETVGMSHRQLDRLFRERVGIGPKPLLRLGRFQRALRMLEQGGRRPIAAAAVGAGYYDEAHLARDFRLFAGLSPGRYLRETRELARNFIADLDSRDGEFFQDGEPRGR